MILFLFRFCSSSVSAVVKLLVALNKILEAYCSAPFDLATLGVMGLVKRKGYFFQIQAERQGIFPLQVDTPLHQRISLDLENPC